ncbi:MAG TPA: protein kinase [Thermoanaerobaculia bacterium]|nr:protein kinase [Thermoanaerobaculia bacterium]
MTKLAATDGAPRRLGPYRIDGRLGGGGMGEVFAAYDERLERRVAIKLVRPEAAADAVARERLRREARAVASLSHPAIVHVHDILTIGGDEGDAIVMELVEGETLAERLRASGCSIDFALRLGAEVAGGLAAAHDRGIVHRDLKAENVMIDAAGRARILDFGVAKRSQAGGEAALTATGLAVGTSRTMSPEQARGLEVDHRTDLFSLGVMLYEAVTGTSPFLAPTSFDTMANVCSYRQRPAVELRPELPDAVSALIDQLLEKDPSRRPQTAGGVEAQLTAAAAAWTGSGAAAPLPGAAPRAAMSGEGTWFETTAILRQRQATLEPPVAPGPAVTPGPLTGHPAAGLPEPAPAARGASRRWAWPALAVALALAIALAAWLALRSRRAPPLYVAVPAAEIGSGRGLDGVDLQAAAVRAALLRGLLSVEGVSPLATEQVDAVAGPPAAVAKATAADEVLASHLDCDQANCRIAVSRVLSNGVVRSTESFEAPAGKPFLLVEAVTAPLRLLYRDRWWREDDSPLKVSAADYEEYLRLDGEVAHHRKAISWSELIARTRLLQQRAPHFLEALYLEAVLLRQRFNAGRDRADLEAAEAALRKAQALAPDDPRPLIGLFDLALRVKQLGDAEAALRRLERLKPGDPEVEMDWGLLLERQGNREEALARMRAAARRRPSRRCLFAQANMEQRLGEYAAARRDLDQLLLRFPDYYEAQSLLAQLELASGSTERAAALYSSLVRRSPQLGELTNLGTAYLLLRRYGPAEECFRRAIRLQPANPYVTLNLADAVLLQGRREEAAAGYRTVVRLTTGDPAADDPQLISVRAQALAHLGERARAVEDAQRVLALAKGHLDAAFEVALVYALVGDEVSALVNARSALERHYEARWFSLPWFDRLRADPEFRRLVPAGGPAGVESPVAAGAVR